MEYLNCLNIAFQLLDSLLTAQYLKILFEKRASQKPKKDNLGHIKFYFPNTYYQ